jgi:hypothetical protein
LLAFIKVCIYEKLCRSSIPGTWQGSEIGSELSEIAAVKEVEVVEEEITCSPDEKKDGGMTGFCSPC